MTLHEKSKEFPPAPKTLTPDIGWLTPDQRDIGSNTEIIHNGVFHCTNKLVPHLYDHKKKNVIHYEKSKNLVDLKVQVKQKHMVISFRQKPWLKPKY